MKFHEKLLRLTESGKPKAQLSVEAGMPPTAISNYLSKEQMPGAQAALRLARVLNVPLDWLIDDDRDEWPAPSIETPSASSMSESELMFEVARRYRLWALDGRRALDELKGRDWKLAATELAKNPLDIANDDRMEVGDQSVRRLLRDLVSRFDAELQAAAHHDQLPGREFKDQTKISPRHMRVELERFCAENQWFQLTRDLVRYRIEHPIPEYVVPIIQRIADEIKRLASEGPSREKSDAAK